MKETDITERNNIKKAKAALNSILAPLDDEEKNEMLRFLLKITEKL